MSARLPSRAERRAALFESGWWERRSARGAEWWVCLEYPGINFTLAAAYRVLALGLVPRRES